MNPHPPLSVTYEGQNIDKSSESAEAFNNHFVTIGPRLAEKIECEESDDPLKYIDNKGSSADAPRFAFQKVTPDSIKREIYKLKLAKSAGHDKINRKRKGHDINVARRIRRCLR